MHRNAHFSPWRVGLLVLLFICCVNRFWTVEALNPLPGQHAPHIDFANHDETIQSIQYNMLLHFLGLGPNMAEYQVSYQNQILKELEDELRRTESSQGLESLLQNLQAAQLRQEALRAVCDSRLGVVHSDAVLAAQNDLLKFFNVPSYGDLCLAFDHYMKKCSSQVEEASNALESAEVALFVAQPQVQIRMQGLKRFRSFHKSLTDVLLLVHENGPEWRRYREGILEKLNEGSVTVDLMSCNHVLPTLMSYVCIHQTQFSKVSAEPMTSQACPSDVVKDLRTIRTLEWEILRAQFIVGLRNFTDQELSDMKHQVEMSLTGLKSSRIQPVPTFDAHRTEVQATYEMYFDSVPHEEIGKPQATTFAIPFPKIPFELFADDLERNFLSDTPSDLVGSWSLLLEDLVRSKKEMQRAFTHAKGESPHGRYFDSYFHRCLNLTRTMDYMKASYGIAEIPLLARSEDSVIHYWYEVIGLSQAQQIKRSLVKLVPSLKLVPFTGLSDQLLRFKSDAYRAFRHISLQLLGWKQSPSPPPQTMPVGGKIGRLSRAETTHELMGEMEDATLSFRLCLETVRRAALKRAYNSESDRHSQTWPWYTTAVDMCSVALKAYISKNGAMQTAWKDQFRTQDIGIWHAKFQDAHERLHTDNIVYSLLTSSHDNRLLLQSLPLVIKRFIVNLDLMRHKIACAQAPNLELTKALTLIESVNIDPVELERIAWDRFVYLQQVTKMLHWDVIRLEEHQSHLFHLQLNALEQVYAIAQDGSAPLKSEILQIHNSVTRFRSLVLDALEMDKLLIDRSEDSIKHSWWQHLDSFEAFRTDFTSLIQHLKSSVSLGKNVRLKVMIRSLDDNNQICEFIQDRYLHVSDSLYAVDLFEELRMARNEVATTQHTPKEFHYSPIQRVALHLCGGKTCPPEIIQMLKELREKEYLMTRSIIVGLMEIFNDDILQDLSVSLTHQYAKLKHSVPEENESADHHGNDLIFSSWIPALQKIQYLITETELLSVHLTATGSLEDNPRVSDRVLDELIALGIFTTANRPSQLTRIELEIVLSEHVSRYVATVMASLPHIVFLDAPNKLSSQTSDPMLDYLFLKHDLEYIVAEQETRGLFFLHHQLLRSALHEKVWSLRSALSLVRNEPILAPSLVLVQRRMALHFFRASYEAYVTVKQWSMDDASLRYDTVLSNMQNLVAEEQQQFSRKLLRAAQRAAWGHSAQASTSSGMDKGDPSSAARPNPSSMVPVPEGALLRLFHVLRILMSDLLAHPIASSKPDQPEPYDKKVRMYSLLSSFMRDQLNHDPMFHIEFTAVRESLSFLALLRRHAFELSTSRHVGEKTPAPTTTEPSFAELLMNRCKDILRFRTAGVLLNAERLIDGFYVQQVLSPSDTTSPSDTEDESPMTHLSIPSTRQWSIHDLSTTPLLDNPLRHGLSTYEKQRRPPRPGEALPVRRTGPSSDHSKRRRDVAWLVVLVVLGVTCAILTAYTIRVVFKEYLQERTHNSFSRHDLAELEDYDSRTFI